MIYVYLSCVGYALIVPWIWAVDSVFDYVLGPGVGPSIQSMEADRE